MKNFFGNYTYNTIIGWNVSDSIRDCILYITLVSGQSDIMPSPRGEPGTNLYSLQYNQQWDFS